MSPTKRNVATQGIRHGAPPLQEFLRVAGKDEVLTVGVLDTDGDRADSQGLGTFGLPDVYRENGDP